MTNRAQIRFWGFIIMAGVLYLLARFGIGLYTDFLWFAHLGLETVFLTRFWAQIAIGLVMGFVFILIFLINTLIARRLSIHNVLFFSDEVLVAQKFILWLLLAATLFLAWIMGSLAGSQWLRFVEYFNQHAFGLTDPIFNQDIGFYIFSLPIFRFIQGWLVAVIILSVIGSVILYAVAQQNNLVEGHVVILPHVQLHLSFLGALLFLVFAFGHWLSLFELMYSPRGVAFGPSYTDVNISMPALWVTLVVALLVAVVLILNTFIRQPRVALAAVGVWIVVGLVANNLVPEIVQRYIVSPNELARETPYIKNNIEYTNLAYGLDKIQERDFSEIATLTEQNVFDNEATLQNIRLWDYRPLQQTYQQIQAIRLYYQFLEPDLDRYMIDGKLRQVALAARELEVNQLQNPTWITQRLQFTHGYGAVVNPVNEVTGEGLPELWVQDLPPKAKVDLVIERPEIYYGEANNGYVFVGTKEREFNYPSGNENVFANYEGTGGVVMDNYFKRLIFALHLADLNMLLSQEFTNESRVLLNRNIGERVRTIAPFLRYDTDPYLVIGDDGQLYWIQDAYTISNRFPYSEPLAGINYIRNSVKIVIDAYDGSATFYVIDETDPVLQTYATIFPNLFTPLNRMPEWQQAHLRYPEGLFRIQAQLYQTYHMRDVNVFYNKEDLWEVPNETFEGDTRPVEPYYVILKLPGESEDEFALIQPFTPNNKDNLIGWMAARSDGDSYGELIVYQFPKQELVFGPLQIEGRIDQNPEISSQITLWDQGGSEVIRGNLLVLPIENALLYVEPLYLRAENGQIPELKRVIVASGNQIVMEETLSEALTALFASGELSTPAVSNVSTTTDTPQNEEETTESENEVSSTTNPELGDDVAELAQTASDHYEAAQIALQQGDWATYGEELDKMQELLERLVEVANDE